MIKINCSQCGYDKHTGSLHIHHTDGDRTNNNKENLLVLCANCHMELHHKSNIRLRYIQNVHEPRTKVCWGNKITIVAQIAQKLKISTGDLVGFYEDDQGDIVLRKIDLKAI